MTTNMKKVLAILSAGLMALMAVSCFPEDEVAVFDPSKITPPSLGSYSFGEEEITVNYLPAKIEVGFNEKMATRHTLAIVALDGSEVSKSLTTSDDGSTLTLKKVNLSKALVSLGKKEGETARVELAVRATIQDASKDNGINGFVDSEKHMGIASFLVEIPEQVGSPYEEYTQKSDWSLIGSMAAYGISWDGDLNMWTDGNGNHVAAHVVLKSGDEVKFRKDQAWTINFGGDFANLGEEFAVAQDGANIKITADGVYDLFLHESGTAIVAAGYDPYPEFTQETNWTVIGSLSKYSISWDGDIDMVSNGTVSAAFGVALSGDDEFKFRQDKAWTVNLGGDFSGLDTDFAVSQDGPNVKVGAEGVYDLFVDPAATSAKVTAACGLKISAKIGAEDPGPGPEPEEVKGWNIIGLNGDWENDILASEKDGVWTAYITAEDATEFKWRLDGAWEKDYGMSKDEGYTYTLGTAFPAVAGGANIPLAAAGFYKVVLDLSNADAPTITVFDDFTVWSLIGVNGDWAKDIDMAEVDGKWVSPATAINGEFKLRKNHGWDVNRGGAFAELGVAFAAVDGGDNINVPEGEYIVTYDPAAETIVVDAAIPSNKWSLIGVNGDWNTDIFMNELVPGVWVSPVVEITSAGWKVRFNHGWDVNRGGKVDAEGVFAKAVPGGDNIELTGKFQVVYNANNETIGTLVWGVVGTITGWGADIPMNLASDGKWYSIPVTLAAGDEIKIRKYAGWDDNFGGDFAEANTAFAAVAGGNNIKAEGTYMVVYDPTAGTLTLSNQFWGLIGDFNSWGGDKFMLFDGANWAAYGQTLAGGWKVRQGAGWDVNRGGVFAAADTPFAAVAGGDNINVGDLANFDVLYNPAAETIFVGDAANAPAPAAAGITIDGNFSDWADITTGVASEASTPVYYEFKITNDATNLYFYSKRDNRSAIWASGGYFYYEMDLDNNESTGTSKNSSNGLEAWLYFKPFAGTSDAHEFATAVKGEASASSVLANFVFKGAENTAGSYVEVESSIPLADLNIKSGDTIKVYSWSNKDGYDVQTKPVVLTLE